MMLRGGHARLCVNVFQSVQLILSGMCRCVVENDKQLVLELGCSTNPRRKQSSVESST